MISARRSLFLLFISISFLVPVLTHAASTTWGSGATLTWHITGTNGGGCTGSVTVNVGSPYDTWSNHTWPINAQGDGSQSLSPFDRVGTFTFFCTVTTDSGTYSGSDTITVTCPAGTAQSGNVCTCNNGATNAPTCNACPNGQQMSGGVCTAPSLCNPVMTVNGASSVTLNVGDTLNRHISNGCPGGVSNIQYNSTYSATGNCANTTNGVVQGWTQGNTGSADTSVAQPASNAGCTFNLNYSFTYNDSQGIGRSASVGNSVTIVNGGQSCGNGATDYPGCTTCPGSQHMAGGSCQSCPNGQTWNGSSCVAGTCNNGATNYPSCTCEYPYSDQGGYCVQVGQPYVVGSPNPCTIAVGGSQCIVHVTWGYPGFFCQSCLTTFDTQNGSSVQIYSPSGYGSDGADINVTPTSPAHLDLYQQAQAAGTPEAQADVTAVCASGSSWQQQYDPIDQVYYGRCVGNIQATLTAAPQSSSAIVLGWNCNAPSAQSVALYRNGSLLGYSSNTSASNVADPNLSANTNYTYNIACFDGPISYVNGAHNTGTQLSSATANATTMAAMPGVNVGSSCGNGATNSPACDRCGSGYIFDGVKCSLIGSGTMCGGSITNYPSGQTSIGINATCGNNIVEAGEECDGTTGLSDPTHQACSSSCSLICSNGNTDAPNCGACPAGQVKVGASCVAACTNGAVQTSAPTCSTCPSGQIFSGGKCITPTCGNGVLEAGEQCDGSAGVGGGQACTYGCCLTSAPAGCYPTFTLTCTNANHYDIKRTLNNNGTEHTGNYTGPVIWTPTSPENYDFICKQGTNQTDQIISVTGSCAATATSAVFNLTANPRTIKQNASAALNWTITNPTALCKIIAVPTITAPTAKCDTSCIISRQNEATRLSTALLKGTTDSSDPFGASRNMTSALTQLVGGKAQGRKSIQMKYSNYFIGSCGLNPLQDINAIKVRVQVADDIEG